MKKTCPFISILILSVCIVSAQNGILKPLKIGDSVPDLELTMINYPKEKINLSEFKGKFVILDFWSTWCPTCISQFPKLEQLQKIFKGQLIILPVGFDANKNGSIKQFIERNKGTKRELKLPTAVQSLRDTQLQKLFPFIGLPQEVWIDINGKLLAITDHLPLTENVIQKVLKGEKVTLPKNLFDPSYDKTLPSLVNNNGGFDSAFVYRSIIIPYNPILKTSLDSNSQYLKLSICNKDLISLLKIAYYGSNKDSAMCFYNDIYNKKFIYEGNVLKYRNKFPDNGDYMEIEDYKVESCFSYEIIMPPSFSFREAYEFMFEDLCRFFRISILIEKRKTACLALIRTAVRNNFKSSQRDRKTNLSETGNFYVPEGTSLQEMPGIFSNQFKNFPIVIDETGYSDKKDFIDLKVENMKDKPLLEIRKALWKYGLDLVIVERELKMFVIIDK